jgi:hypothetical protein
MTVDKLTKALTEAAEAHHVYEQKYFPRQTDPNWQRWYATWIIDRYGPLETPVSRPD